MISLNEKNTGQENWIPVKGETPNLFCKGISFGVGQERPFIKSKDSTPTLELPQQWFE